MRPLIEHPDAGFIVLFIVILALGFVVVWKG